MGDEINYGEVLQTLARTDPSSERETCECVAMLFWYGLQARTILELGVHRGFSTQTFLVACRRTGGHLYSVDIVDCPFAREAVKTHQLEPFWTFTVQDDVEYAKTWNNPIDLLFVDSSHQYDHTLAELRLYSSFLTEKGVILLHDTIGSKSPKYAAEKFMEENPEWQLKELLPTSRYGLGELRKK